MTRSLIGSHFSYLGGKARPTTRDVYCYAESSDGR